MYLAILVVVFLLGCAEGEESRLPVCPQVCDCKGLTVDCGNRQLKSVPRPLPKEAKRINLEGNNITVIRADDFEGLNQVQIMQLMENQIHLIEKGAFQDLVSMERLRLNNNRLRSLPDLLFSTMPNLLRLDLSNNRLGMIGKKTLRGAPLLKNLQMDNNEITCVDDISIKMLKDMEILTLNKNNITTLGKDLFEGMKKLRVLRISDNPFTCDCHLSWLAGWLRRNPRLGLFSKCNLPLYLKNKAIAELHEFDFRCTGAEEEPPAGCSREPMCPHPCSCYDGVVDCRDKGLSRIPDHIPDTATELRLEQNQIREISPKAFSSFKRLKRIDLSNNEISKVAGDAFTGLKTLTSLVLYGNKITDLTNGVFKGLSSLQLLLLNANKISCLRKDTFSDLHNLNLLSLYDNNIQSLANGTFNSMHNIQTLHLARNPFICDCNLRWLAEYLHTNPIETSGARCETPRRMHRRRISQMRETKYKCKGWYNVGGSQSAACVPLVVLGTRRTTQITDFFKGAEAYRSRGASECASVLDCPEPCVCEGSIVDCSGKRLRDIPENIPAYTTELRLNNNAIQKVRNNGFFKKMQHLNKIDLSSNEISEIEDGAFHGANQLTDLLLTENKLKDVESKMFSGISNLKTLMLRTNLLTCISNGTFSGMESLQLLSLYDNRITHIMNGAFDKMPALTTLNLLANPLKCSCRLRWLSDWLKKTTIVTGNPRCQAPMSLKDIPIQDVEKKDFRCDGGDRMEEDEGCGSTLTCPLGCTCTGTVVHCSRRKLKSAPRNIPPTTTELYLDVNDISRMPEDLNIFKDLERLDLSNNQITVLPNNIVSNLSKLSTLILSYNKLQCIQVDSLLGLKSLRILSLQGNDISMIPDGAFRELVSITHIALGANPLYCDCNLRWLSEWIKQDYIEPGIARCAEPRSMKDKLVLTAASNGFVCTGKPEAEVLAKCDACYTFPCQNGATCKPKPLRDYECICAPGYHGPKCEYVIDACYGNPCENGGTCKVMEAGRFSCHCPSGYEGDRCETNIDDCLDNKCENNSTCVDRIEEYECRCNAGYTGNYCEKKINFCSKEFNPCKNGATCIDENYSYSCACSLGFTGDNCTVNINDCLDHLCQNGGTCIDGINTYRCQCQDGFSGAFCELENMVDLLYPQTSPCQHHDCKHGVCFMPSNAKDYICKCSQGFTGKRCEFLTSINFHDGSYVELDPLHTKPDAKISITFATEQTYGVMLYNGESQHLAVELFRGRIRVSYDVGNYPVSTMFSYETVSDGEPHTVELTLIKKNFTMRVDNGTSRTIVNEGVKEYLEVKTPLYVGGVSEEAASSALRQWHLRNESSFDGCIKDVRLNGKLLDFMNARKQQRVAPGCSDLEDPKPCKDHLCKKGKCIPLDKASYECQCRKGWSGEHCDQAPTCQKEQYREYLEENGCRSNKMIKMANCVGSCGDQCCRPQRIKRRSVRMMCPNGTKYTTQVDVIRKCKCVQKC